MTSRTPVGDALLPRLRATLAGRSRMSLANSGHRLLETAVLLPLCLPESADEPPELLYIVRQGNLKTHSGQIAFPGGKREPDDPSLEHTALRESREEVGLQSELVELYGLLDDVPTLERFAITPVVGIVRGRPPIARSESEVADTFSASLPALVACYRRGEDFVYASRRHVMPEFLFPDPRATDSGGVRRIWGATARITYQFLELLELLPPFPKV